MNAHLSHFALCMHAHDTPVQNEKIKIKRKLAFYILDDKRTHNWCLSN